MVLRPVRAFAGVTGGLTGRLKSSGGGSIFSSASTRTAAAADFVGSSTIVLPALYAFTGVVPIGIDAVLFADEVDGPLATVIRLSFIGEVVRGFLGVMKGRGGRTTAFRFVGEPAVSRDGMEGFVGVFVGDSVFLSERDSTCDDFRGVFVGDRDALAGEERDVRLSLTDLSILSLRPSEIIFSRYSRS